MITLDNVTKSYLTLRGRKVVFRNLSLEIPEGKNIGLIGRNGAGKSTLMRLISAVELPDSGKVITKAKLSWPVGLSGGMQKNLSARDNVKFVCRVHGVRGPEIQEKIRFVQEFAEIDEWFEQPVSTYSSGMRARVAFGMSMAFEFDYYLIDEVMSVGDATFKRKSKEFFRERLQRSKVILVTHNMKRIRRMCEAVVHLDGGRAFLYEDVLDGIKAYHESRARLEAEEAAAGKAQAIVAPGAGDVAPGGDITPAPSDDQAAATARAVTDAPAQTSTDDTAAKARERKARARVARRKARARARKSRAEAGGAS